MKRWLDVPVAGGLTRFLGLALAAMVALNAWSGAAHAQSTPVLVGQSEEITTEAGTSARVTEEVTPATDREGLLRDLRAAADEKGLGELPELSIDVAFFNQYVWRGIVLTDDPVMQPSLSVAWHGFSLNVWGNLDLTGVNDNRGQFNEVDYTFDYTHAFGPVEATLGVVHYRFPNTAFEATTELFLGLSLPDVLLTPSIKAYFDVDEADGWYVTGDISHSFELPRLCDRFDWSLDLGAGLGWASASHNAFYFGVDSSAFVDFHGSIGLPIKLTHWLTLTPQVLFTSILDGDLRDAVADPDNLTYGINVTIVF